MSDSSLLASLLLLPAFGALAVPLLGLSRSAARGLTAV
jgi:hypothetical protein